MNNHLSEGFLTPSVSNDSVLAEKSKYRRESFLRWKNKRFELKEADEHRIDLHEAIVEPATQLTIVAFICSYEATFRGQTDMKVISGTTSNVANPPTTSLPAKQASEITKSESVIKPATDKGNELFSPTTKLVLEEISSTIASKAVIRSQPFSNKDLDSETVAHILAIKKAVGDQDMEVQIIKKRLKKTHGV
ncbi:hypothetical protein Tco_0291068 [Tanacetum coccineum]